MATGVAAAMAAERVKEVEVERRRIFLLAA